MIRASVDSNLEQLAQTFVLIQSQLIDDSRPCWRKLGVRIRDHITGRFRDPLGAGLAPLADSTQRSKKMRWGYYKRAPGATPLPQGTALSFFWTGKAWNKAVGAEAFRVEPRQLTYDFGRNDAPRKRLEHMHFGGKHRPARPVYDLRTVEGLMRQTWDEWAEYVIGKFGGGGKFVLRWGEAT